MNASLSCSRCRTDALPTVTRAGPHLKATCSRCGCYLRFVPQSKPWTDMVQEKPMQPQGSLFTEVGA